MFSRSGVARLFSFFLSAGVLAFLFAPGAQASAMNRRTVVLVNTPVQVPGKVLLPGTYTFRTVFSSFDWGVVKIANTTTGKPLGIFLVMPTDRPQVPNKAHVTLAERPSDTPPAISKWFYPGDATGMEFIYPRPARQLMAALKHNSQTARG